MTGSSLYRPIRNFGCRIYDDFVLKSSRALTLENELVQIILLLDRGGEPFRWLYKPTDTDLIWFSRRGMLPAHPVYSDYQMSYLGGWQEMFPEVSETHVYRGATLHRGESSLLPWDYEILKDDPGEIAVKLRVRLQSMPFRLEKTIRLTSGSAKVRVDETLINESPATALEANWGHHLAFGPPLLQESSTVTFHKDATVHNPITHEVWKWPEAAVDGEAVDLSWMPPAGTKRDLLYVSAPDGEYRLTSPERNISVAVKWNREVWPYVWYWQNFRSDLDHPFFGCDYNIGLEMFNVPPKLTVAEAVKEKLALSVPPKGRLETWLEIDIERLLPDGPISNS